LEVSSPPIRRRRNKFVLEPHQGNQLHANLVQGFGGNRNQRPYHRTRFEPVGDLHRPNALGEMLREGVIDPILHQNAVGADAGLAGIAVFERELGLLSE
jgi:hypothetical protein